MSPIKKDSPLCLRHSFITNLIVDQKEDYATVMSLSGHKDIKMLQRYTHTHQKSKRLAVEKLKNMVNIESIDTYIDTMDHLDNVSDIDKKVVTN